MNPLDPIIEWHQTARDALRVTLRVIRMGTPGVVTSRHVFDSLPPADSAARVGLAKGQLDNVTVLSLVAVFERLLRDYVASVIQNRFLPSGVAEVKILDAVCDDSEFWNFSSRLIDVFENVQVDVRGRAKQFIDFRNWLAHGRHAGAVPQSAPIQATPRDVHRVLTEFLQQAGIA